jgi:cardiolipin synthase
MLLCFLALLSMGAAPWWLVLLVIARDAAIAMGWLLVRLLALPVPMAASLPGKASTAMQILYVGGCLLLLAFDLDAPGLMLAASVLTAGLTVLSGLGYGLALLRALLKGQRTI